MSSKLLIMVLMLAGCATQTEYVEVPVPVDRFVQVPEELTQPCTRPEMQPETWADLAMLAQAALAVIDQCNSDKLSIRNLK